MAEGGYMVSSFVPYSRQPFAVEQLLVVARAVSTKLIRVIHIIFDSPNKLWIYFISCQCIIVFLLYSPGAYLVHVANE